MAKERNYSRLEDVGLKPAEVQKKIDVSESLAQLNVEILEQFKQTLLTSMTKEQADAFSITGKKPEHQLYHEMLTRVQIQAKNSLARLASQAPPEGTLQAEAGQDTEIKAMQEKILELESQMQAAQAEIASLIPMPEDNERMRLQSKLKMMIVSGEGIIEKLWEKRDALTAQEERGSLPIGRRQESAGIQAHDLFRLLMSLHTGARVDRLRARRELTGKLGQKEYAPFKALIDLESIDECHAQLDNMAVLTQLHDQDPQVRSQALGQLLTNPEYRNEKYKAAAQAYHKIHKAWTKAQKESTRLTQRLQMTQAQAQAEKVTHDRRQLVWGQLQQRMLNFADKQRPIGETMRGMKGDDIKAVLTTGGYAPAQACEFVQLRLTIMDTELLLKAKQNPPPVWLRKMEDAYQKDSHHPEVEPQEFELDPKDKITLDRRCVLKAYEQLRPAEIDKHYQALRELEQQQEAVYQEPGQTSSEPSSSSASEAMGSPVKPPPVSLREQGLFGHSYKKLSSDQAAEKSSGCLPFGKILKAVLMQRSPSTSASEETSTRQAPSSTSPVAAR